MFRLLLAVALLLCTAQVQSAVTSQHPVLLLQALGDATRALQAAQQSLEDALQTSTSQPTSPWKTLTSVSVVQDWSLVCKELCGAGLGVAPCANYCAKTEKILNTVYDLAKCEQLHGSQSGAECNGVESVKSYGQRLCSSFCHQRRSTLSGCSPCPLLSILDEVSTEQSVTTHGSGEGSKADKVEQLRALGEVEQIEEAAAAAEDADADTPDWDEMCKALCKTGDGGSLCNCDLSPFFS